MARKTGDEAMKWLTRAAGGKDQPRAALRWIYSADGRAAAADGYRLHLDWSALPDPWTPTRAADTSAGGMKARGQFPDYLAVLPHEAAARFRATVDSAELARALKLAAAVDPDGDWLRLTLIPAEGRLHVKARNAWAGDVETALKCGFHDVAESAPAVVALDPHYLRDALTGFEGPVTLHYFGGAPHQPAPFVIGDYGRRVACIMPRALNHDMPSAPAPEPVYDTTLPLENGAAPAPKKRAAKKAARAAKRLEAPEMLTTDTDADGRLHERVTYRRGAAAFADVPPMLTNARKAAFRAHDFRAALERSLGEARYQRGMIVAGPLPQGIVILVRDGQTREAYRLRQRGGTLQLLHYVRVGDSDGEETLKAQLEGATLGEAWTWCREIARVNRWPFRRGRGTGVPAGLAA